MFEPKKNLRAIGLLSLLYVSVYIFIYFATSKTQGFGPYDEALLGSRLPTVWDWMQLLIIPAMLALVAWRLEASERKADREIAEQRTRIDRRIAKDNQRQVALETYYDRMTELLLEKKLRKEGGEDYDSRTVARIRTIAVLHGLDRNRKAQVIQFLHESLLIEKDKPLVILEDANFSGTYLKNANLQDSNLSGINFSHANFQGADLQDADLRGAILRGTNLWDANLSGVNFRGAFYSQSTIWPTDFNVQSSGALWVEDDSES